MTGERPAAPVFGYSVLGTFGVPLVLACGHTHMQHGDLGCARVMQIEADIERVKRREERRERWRDRLLPPAWRSM